MGGRPGASIEVSCLIEGGAYQSCRMDHTLVGNRPASARRSARGLNGTRVQPDLAEANEGHVVYVFIPLLLVVRD